MKKVGLITYYGNNYGGLLQAFALQQLIEKQEMECQIISNSFLYRKTKATLFKSRIRALFSAAKAPVSYMRKRSEYHKYQGQNMQKLSRFEEFRKTYLHIHETGFATYDEYLLSPPEFDVYICGSDQIWNPNLYSDNGFYFADFAPKSAPRISYASSIGLSQVDKKQANFLRPLLNSLDVISTREAKGAEIIKDVTGKEARVVLDPTLLLSQDDWSKVASGNLIDEPYVFCYLFGERDYYCQIKSEIEELTGLKFVCIPFVPRELSSEDEKIFDAGPAEFISLIKNAALVLTDSFHATAFSVIFKTPFVSLCRFSKSDKKSMNDRLVTILNTLGLDNRLVDEGDGIDRDSLFDVDFDSAHIKLNEKRTSDTEFLIDALNMGKE